MPCYYPWTHHEGGAKRLLSCGQCIGCRLEKSRQWAVRCVHEASLYQQNCYLTLTYNDDNIPADNNLEHRDFQLFMKKLRKHVAPTKIRYYMAGEYGEQKQRPHFHAAIFNYDFTDKKLLKTTTTGHVLYISPTLEKIWTKGFSSIGGLTFESAAYIARYIMKKVTGESAEKHYEGREPEYNEMSRMPGIGKGWLKKYKSDVYPEGTLIINAQKVRPPRYYDQEYKKSNPRAYARMLAKRAEEALSKIEDNDDSRLQAKESVKLAQLTQLKRKI